MRLRKPEKSWGIDAHANPHFSPFAFSLPLSPRRSCKPHPHGASSGRWRISLRLDAFAKHTRTELLLLRAGAEFIRNWTFLQGTAHGTSSGRCRIYPWLDVVAKPQTRNFFGQAQIWSVTEKFLQRTSLFFGSPYIYSQKSKFKIKSAEIKWFLGLFNSHSSTKF
jgi:hypothetical protein